MSTQKDSKSNPALENIDQENDSKTNDQEYQEFLEKHNMNEMNLPFGNFLRRAELFSVAEAGAL